MSDKGHFLEFDVQHLEKLPGFNNNLPVLPERMKTKNNRKLVASLYG